MIPIMLYILLGLVTILVISGVIYLLVIIFKERREPPDSPMLVNFMAHRSNGRAFGVETHSRKIANRHILEFAPKDIDMLKYKQKVINNEKIIVDDYMQISLPKGTLSTDKNVKFLLPINPEDLPYSLKIHPLGKMLMNYIKMQNLTETEIDVLRETVARQKVILVAHASGEISEKHIEMLDSLMSDMIKMTAKQKEPNKFDVHRPQ